MSSEQNSAILEIAAVTSDDSGVYKCVASNDLGLDACSITLSVQGTYACCRLHELFEFTPFRVR